MLRFENFWKIANAHASGNWGVLGTSDRLDRLGRDHRFPVQEFKVTMIMRLIFAAAIMLALAGCATPYQKRGLSGGFTEYHLKDGIYVLQFSANGYTSSITAEKYFYRRAKELTAEKGFDDYRVTELDKDYIGKPKIKGKIHLFNTRKKISEPIKDKKVKRRTLDTTPSSTKLPKFSPGVLKPHDVAVIIGNSNYKRQGNDIPNVDPAHADAENFKRWVTKARGVREGNIIYLKDATSAQMESAFGNERSHKGQLFNWTKPGVSNVYVYYSGHGAPAGDEGSAYIVPSDSNAATVDLTGYPLATLYKNLTKLPAKSITVVLEACFSGASQNGNVVSRTSGLYVSPKIPTAPSNITIISAGRADQVASWEQDSSQSLFTKYFLKGMNGEADEKPYGNGNGDVSYSELGKYLDGTMTYYARRYYGRDQNAQIVVGVQ